MVIVDVPILINTAYNCVKMWDATDGFLMKPDSGFTPQDVSGSRKGLALSVMYGLPVELFRKLLPQFLPIVNCEVFGVLHCRTNLYMDYRVLDAGMAVCREGHFQPNAHCVQIWRKKHVTYMTYLFRLFLVLRLAFDVPQGVDAMRYCLCFAYHWFPPFSNPFVVRG